MSKPIAWVNFRVSFLSESIARSLGSVRRSRRNPLPKMGIRRRKTWKLANKQLPADIRNKVLQELHAAPTAGHLGMNKTLSKVRIRFYWVGMRADIRSFIRQCPVCSHNKSGGRKRRAPLQQRRCGGPLERIALDFMDHFPPQTMN